MSMQLGRDAEGGYMGMRDAVHIPIVLARIDHNVVPYETPVNPGDWVTFTDPNFRTIRPCSKEQALGLVDPFLETVNRFDLITVILKPGITTTVRHVFEINPALLEAERLKLEEELEAIKQDNPACAGCWAIKNGRIIRY